MNIRSERILLITLAFFAGFSAHWAIENVWQHQPEYAFWATLASLILVTCAVVAASEQIR